MSNKLPGFFQDRVVGLDEARPHLRPEPDLSGADGGGTSNNMERRVAALEKGFEKLDGKIDKLTELVNSFGLKTSERLGAIEGRLTGLEKTLDAKASTADVKLVEGKVSSIPTTWQIVGLMGALVVGTLGGVAGLAFVLARQFGKVP